MTREPGKETGETESLGEGDGWQEKGKAESWARIHDQREGARRAKRGTFLSCCTATGSDASIQVARSCPIVKWQVTPHTYSSEDLSGDNRRFDGA